MMELPRPGPMLSPLPNKQALDRPLQEQVLARHHSLRGFDDLGLCTRSRGAPQQLTVFAQRRCPHSQPGWQHHQLLARDVCDIHLDLPQALEAGDFADVASSEQDQLR